MEPLRLEERGERIDVAVVDDAGVRHEIAVGVEGSVLEHDQEGYPEEPAERTPVEDERLQRARRFAGYHVYCELGHPTRPVRTIPAWLAIAATVVTKLPPTAFDAHFGRYRRQLRSALGEGDEPILAGPAVDVAGATVYRLEIHLDLDPAVVLVGCREEVTNILAADEDYSAMEARLAWAIAYTAEPGTAHRLGVTGVSDVGVLYQGHTREVVGDADDPNPGRADARLELSPASVPWGAYRSLERGFQLLVVHHLLCQARDRYLEMGLEVPVGLRVLGPGTYRQTARAESLELYEAVHDASSAVAGYRKPDHGIELQG